MSGWVSPRTAGDALVVDVARDLVRHTDPRAGGPRWCRKDSIALGDDRLVCRARVPCASVNSLDRAMQALDLSGVRRDKHVRTTVPVTNGIGARDLLNQDFSTRRPTGSGCRLHLYPILVPRLGPCGVHHGRVLATDPWGMRRQSHRPVLPPLRLALGQPPEQRRRPDPSTSTPGPK
jgi:hypothetical protein